MSEHHTRISSAQLIAEEEEREALETGNSKEVKKAEEKIAKNIARQKANGEKLVSRLTEEQRRNLEQVHDAIDNLREDYSAATVNATAVQNRLNRLDTAIVDASSRVDRIVNDAKNSYATAEQLYVEMSKRFIATETLVEYRRFVGDMQASVRDRLAKMNGREVSASAYQLLTTSVIADIYQMDLIVAKKQAVFDAKWAEATRILETAIGHCKSARSQNYAEIGNPQSELLDINFWTNGQFNDLEAELDRLSVRLNAGYEDASYTTEDLEKDLKRVHELDKMKEMLIAEARLAYNQSVMREEQAMAAMDILEETHYFSIVGKGFEGNDRREAFILRMRRHTDGAEIEVIVSPTPVVGEYNIYFRLDTKTYSDESVMQCITDALAEDFKEAGLKIDVNHHCTAETLEPFNPGCPTISNQARMLHGIAPMGSH